jgi:hypothetical protein
VVVLQRHATGAALPGQLAGDLAVGKAEVGVGLQPAGAAVLVLAELPLQVGGPVGLLGGDVYRGVLEHDRLVTAA